MSNARVIKSVMVAVALLGLGACAEDPTGEVPQTTATTPGFGEAFLTTMTNQIVDPTPVDLKTPPNLHGDRASLAIERYKTNTSVRPRVVGTGATAGGGGGQ
jgi:hypothetical protein